MCTVVVGCLSVSFLILLFSGKLCYQSIIKKCNTIKCQGQINLFIGTLLGSGAGFWLLIGVLEIEKI